MVPNKETAGKDSPERLEGQADLRRQAEAILAAQEAAGGSAGETAVLHELRVHQVELEMQNEELRRTQLELEASRQRYLDLYEFAPVGYCTISENGLVLDSNLTAAVLLNVPRSALLGQRFTQFILPLHQDIFYQLRKRLMEGGGPQACELYMMRTGAGVFWARLEAALVEDAEGARPFRRVISDISPLIQAQEALKRSLQENELLLRELTHRVKNSLAVVDSLLALEQPNMPDERSAAILASTRSRIQSMVTLYGLLSSSGGALQVDLSHYFQALVSLISESILAAGSPVGIQQRLEPLQLDVKRALPLGMILNELLTNALKFAFPPGSQAPGGEPTIRVDLGQTSGLARLCVADNGVGLPVGGPPAGGRGLALVQVLSRQIGGSFQWLESSQGCTACVTFSLAS